jgi:hypothetical protein
MAVKVEAVQTQGLASGQGSFAALNQGHGHEQLVLGDGAE